MIVSGNGSDEEIDDDDVDDGESDLSDDSTCSLYLFIYFIVDSIYLPLYIVHNYTMYFIIYTVSLGVHSKLDHPNFLLS